MAQIIKIGSMWYSDLRLDGRRVRRALSKFKPEADRLLRDLVEVRRAQRHGDVVRDMSWSHFKERCLAEVLSQWDKNTHYAYSRAFDMVDATAHLTYLKQMSPDRLGQIKTSWINSGEYTHSTISRSIQALLAGMRWAEDLKFIDLQNWRTVKVKTVPHRTDYYTREGYVELLGKIADDWFTAALIMGRAGLRLGEMLHLEWEDIHFNSWEIVFRSKPHLISIENPQGWFIKKDKNIKKVRCIPILSIYPDLRQHLYTIRKHTGFVLGPNVSRLEHGFSRQLSDALKQTGIKTHDGKLGFPHLLRHTFGSHLAQIGVPLQMIQAWMGHESLRMTERYSHLRPRNTEADNQAVEKLLSTFVPVTDSGGLGRPLLSAFNADLGNSETPS